MQTGLHDFSSNQGVSPMKRFMLTVALTCILSVSALAGEMPTCGVVAPSPTPATATTTDPGEIPTAGTASSHSLDFADTQHPSPTTLLTTVIVAIITWP